jgi:hypothetical protein
MEEELNIKYLNNNEKIIKYNSESNYRFNERLKIIKIFESQKLKWKEANKLSKIWYNIKYNKCKYPPAIYKHYIYYNNLYEKQLNNST